MKMNLGAGDVPLPGYEPVDARAGKPAYPLACPDNSAEEIYASHLLEHFGWRETLAVLKDWVRALAPGGRLRIAVPDLDWVLDRLAAVRAGKEPDCPVESWLFGSQDYPENFHKACFTRAKLNNFMVAAGLENIGPWKSEIQDCAAEPVSLNLQGYKPKGAKMGGLRRAVARIKKAVTRAPKPPPKLRTAGVISCPRYGLTANFISCVRGLLPNGVTLHQYGGAFWSQGMERGMMVALAGNPDAILTLDFDTVFTTEDLAALIQTYREHPEADAIAPIQIARGRNLPLLTVKDAAGMNRVELDGGELAQPLLKVGTAHFGLTMIRPAALRKVPHPWFHSIPSADGTWSEGRVDDDIYFWRMWEKAGNSVYVAPRVPVGHIVERILWPDVNFKACYQATEDFTNKGKPPDVWR